MTTPKLSFSPALRPSMHRAPSSYSGGSPLVRTPTLRPADLQRRQDSYFPDMPREENEGEPAQSTRAHARGPRRWGQTVYSVTNPPTLWGGVKKVGRAIRDWISCAH